MRKLELKDICGYFPYGLKVNQKGFPNRTINPMKRNRNERGMCIGDFFWITTEKPILRPLSDLYKETTNNGSEPFIPIVELAQIVFTDSKFELSNNRGKLCALSGDRKVFYECGVFLTENASGCVWGLVFQYQLFDKLNEWKIDYRGLIDAGLAVSVYDLSENPYK